MYHGNIKIPLNKVFIKKIFPVPVGHFNDLEFTNKVLPIVEEIFDKIEPNKFGYKTSYENKEIELYLKSFEWVKNKIYDISYKFVKETGFNFNSSIKIGSLFVSKMDKKNFHGPHIHPNSILSGVLYLKTSNNSAPIIFDEPKQVRFFNGLIANDDKKDTNIEFATFQPKSGDGLIFESWLPHRIPENKNDERITLVFNIDKD